VLSLVAMMLSSQGLIWGAEHIARALGVSDLLIGLTILAFGTLLTAAESVAERLDLTLVDMRFVKPIDHALIKMLAQSHQGFVTIEESSVMGGAGSAVCESLNAAGLTLPILQLGLPDVFIDHGDQVSLLAGVGLDETGIEQSIRARFKDLP